MTGRAALAHGLLLSCAVFIAGCQPQAKPAYYGPTDSLDELVAHVNANNAQIPSLWARQDFQGTIVDEKHQAHAASAHGVLLYRAPHELRIVADDDFGQLLFELGTTEDVYWLKVLPGMDTLWWGRMANAARPCTDAMPVRPDLILDVLGIATIDPDLSRPPYSVLRFDNDADAYVVESIDEHSDRLILRREIWYDRPTLHPAKVRLYDDTGRMVLNADLSDYEPLPLPGVAKAAWPQLPTRYDLLFPASGSTMQFLLRQPSLSKNGIPGAGSIRIPDLQKPGVRNVIQIDKDCGP
jgi:hypothetical protein